MLIILLSRILVLGVQTAILLAVFWACVGMTSKVGCGDMGDVISLLYISGTACAKCLPTESRHFQWVIENENENVKYV